MMIMMIMIHDKLTAISVSRTWSKGMPSNLEMPQPVHKSVWVQQVTNLYVAAQALIPCGQNCGGLLKHFFLDPARPGRPRLCAGDTCHWNMCHHTMHSINSGHQTFAQKEICHWNNKFQTFFKQSLWVFSLNLRGVQQDSHFQLSFFLDFRFQVLGLAEMFMFAIQMKLTRKSEKGCYQQDPLNKQ